MNNFFSQLNSLFSGAGSGSDSVTTVLPRAFADQLKATPGAQLIDVRTPQEFKGGHIAKARNLNVQDRSFQAMAENLKKDQPVFVYCRSGGRSRMAASQLAGMGFEQIYDLSGGITSWAAKGMKVTQ